MIFKEHRFICASCGGMSRGLQWESDPNPVCCGVVMQPETTTTRRAPAVIGDDIPGGMVLEHVAHRDGEPQRFYSKEAMREAARKAGWTRYGETPKHSKYREV